MEELPTNFNQIQAILAEASSLLTAFVFKLIGIAITTITGKFILIPIK
jgi:low affinity Fe/Cu permease